MPYRADEQARAERLRALEEENMELQRKLATATARAAAAEKAAQNAWAAVEAAREDHARMFEGDRLAEYVKANRQLRAEVDVLKERIWKLEHP